MWRYRGACVVAVVLALCAAVPAAEVSRLQAPALRATIPAQPLPGALDDFRKQTGLQVVYESGVVAGKRSRRVGAKTAPDVALTGMLRGTGLRYELLNPRTVMIAVAPPRPALVRADPRPEPDTSLPEVAVTGWRDPGFDRVPADVVALDRADLEEAGVKGIADIGILTPGVEFDVFSTVGGGIYTNLGARGVTDRHNVVTGVWLDDLPLPPAASNSMARVFPFYFDLAGVEVWRSPQPVLLGANTQGGAVRFVTTPADLHESSRLLQLEWAETARGDPSGEVGVVIGEPLVEDRLALRLSGWYRRDGGFVDRVDPFTCGDPVEPLACTVVEPNADLVTSKSLRAALTFQPARSVSIAPSWSYGSSAVNDTSAFMTYLSDTPAGEFNNGSLRRQPFTDAFHLASVKVQARLWNADLRSVSGFFRRSAHAISEDSETARWGGWGNPLGEAFPASHDDAVTTEVTFDQYSLMQELRLASSGQQRRVSWLVGAFYSDTRGRETDHVVAARVPLLNGAPLDFSATTSRAQARLAGFGQFAWRIDGQFALTAGLRVERERYDVHSAAFAWRGRRAGTIAAPEFKLSYDAGADGFYYLSAAKGYSPGSVEAARPTCGEPPVAYPTDTLWSREFGARRDLWGGRVHADLNLFHIHWDNGPLNYRSCLFMHLPGKARSRGFSINAQARLGGGVRAGLGLSYVDARYLQTIRHDGSITVIDIGRPIAPDPARVIVRAGNALGTPPLVPSPWSLMAWTQKRFELGERTGLELRVEGIFRSRNPGPFYTADPEALFPAPGLRADPPAHLVNARAALKFRRVDLTLFVNNVLDRRTIQSRRNKGNDEGTLFYASVPRPRTAGISATARF